VTYQILSKLDSRRVLIEFGATILRTLFGTATLTALHSWHETLDELKSRDSDIAHSFSSQISYIKNLDSTVKINAAGIANLSNVFNDIVIQSNKHYQQVNRDLMWLNFNLFGHSRIFTDVRELEFTLLHFI
jgi:xylose isomerase